MVDAVEAVEAVDAVLRLQPGRASPSGSGLPGPKQAAAVGGVVTVSRMAAVQKKSDDGEHSAT